MPNTFRKGQNVIKPTGYPFPGTVLGSFRTLAGEERVVVESYRAPGLLHIFAPHQLMLDKPVTRGEITDF
jgi:hypothetical protein